MSGPARRAIHLHVREEREGEREAIVRLWGETMRDAHSYLPPGQQHTFADDLAYFSGHIAARCQVWVAEEASELLGFLAIAGSYLDRLYVHPNHQRRGVGTALLRKAIELSPAGLELHTHRKNTPACAFYARHGFLPVRYGVSPPPESEPDVEYHWRPEREERKHMFDTVAEQYDAIRSDYPEELVERVIARAGLTPESRLLEVGCGTAIATLPYARRGHRILCIEPGGNLARIARKKLEGFDRVEVVETEFEAWPEEPDAFDLVYSASAWHHLDPDVAYAKAARALRPGGTLALYWIWPETNFEEGQEAYREHVPEWAGGHLPTIDERIAGGIEGLTLSGLFGEVEAHRFPVTRTFTADEYGRLVGTFSDHLLLPREKREGLLRGLHASIERMGGTMERRYVVGLFLARK